MVWGNGRFGFLFGRNGRWARRKCFVLGLGEEWGETAVRLSRKCFILSLHFGMGEFITAVLWCQDGETAVSGVMTTNLGRNEWETAVGYDNNGLRK